MSCARLSLLTLACLPVWSQAAPIGTAATAERSLERLTVFGQRQNDQFGSKSGIALAELPQSVQLLNVAELRAPGPAVGRRVITECAKRQCRLFTGGPLSVL